MSLVNLSRVFTLATLSEVKRDIKHFTLEKHKIEHYDEYAIIAFCTDNIGKNYEVCMKRHLAKGGEFFDSSLFFQTFLKEFNNPPLTPEYEILDKAIVLNDGHVKMPEEYLNDSLDKINSEFQKLKDTKEENTLLETKENNKQSVKTEEKKWKRQIIRDSIGGEFWYEVALCVYEPEEYMKEYVVVVSDGQYNNICWPLSTIMFSEEEAIKAFDNCVELLDISKLPKMYKIKQIGKGSGIFPLRKSRHNQY